MSPVRARSPALRSVRSPRYVVCNENGGAIESPRATRQRRALVKDIARVLRVAQSSVSVWVRDIELTEKQHQELIHRARCSRVQAWSAYWRGRRRTFQEHGRQIARRGEGLHAAGCMLYWAEGEKASRNVARIANADPELVRLFLRFVRAYFEVSDEQIRVTCNLFADHLERQREIEQFWLDTLELPAHVALPLDRERLLQVQPEEAAEQAALRDVQGLHQLDGGRAEHLRLDSEVRWLRAPGVARLTT